MRGAEGSGCGAGQWRGVEVAIKTVVLSSDDADQVTSSVAREAAIATNLGHANVVATYSHDVCVLPAPSPRELGVCKIYLIQVRTSCACPGRARARGRLFCARAFLKPTEAFSAVACLSLLSAASPATVVAACVL